MELTMTSVCVCVCVQDYFIKPQQGYYLFILCVCQSVKSLISVCFHDLYLFVAAFGQRSKVRRCLRCDITALTGPLKPILLLTTLVAEYLKSVVQNLTGSDDKRVLVAGSSGLGGL